jgi:hypothetical protein
MKKKALVLCLVAVLVCILIREIMDRLGEVSF